MAHKVQFTAHKKKLLGERQLQNTAASASHRYRETHSTHGRMLADDCRWACKRLSNWVKPPGRDGVEDGAQTAAWGRHSPTDGNEATNEGDSQQN